MYTSLKRLYFGDYVISNLTLKCSQKCQTEYNSLLVLMMINGIIYYCRYNSPLEIKIVFIIFNGLIEELKVFTNYNDVKLKIT